MIMVLFEQGDGASSQHPAKHQDLFFRIIFEICSAYGTSGLSLESTSGETYGRYPFSFSGTWCTVSKLAIIGVMLLGKLRGVPESIDPSVRVGRAAYAGKMGSKAGWRRPKRYYWWSVFRVVLWSGEGNIDSSIYFFVDNFERFFVLLIFRGVE